MLSLVGGSCAVSVPISLSVSGGSGEANKVSLKRCLTSEDIAEILLAQDGGKPTCWDFVQDSDSEVQGGSTHTLETSKNTLINQVLEDIWAKGIESWKKQGDERWRVDCLASDKGWKIEVEGTEVVKGYCEKKETSSVDSDEFPNLMFLEHSSDSNQNLRVCTNGNNCWTGSYDPQSLNTFSRKDGGEWYELKFYKN